ncbi:hypothetical protein PUN4_220021 [Paraburkholderia unamae]|nr:hypothetical protein PUN4_220021 [Paraburkholderia unamae]
MPDSRAVVLTAAREMKKAGKKPAFQILVPKRGLEPPQCCHRQDLNLVRLPIPPPGQGVAYYFLLRVVQQRPKL